MASCRKTSLRTCNDRPHGNELFDMNSREHIWSEAMRAERQGDVAAYERLLKELADLLRKMIRHRLAQYGLGADDTEDLVQEVLIGLHTKRHAWDASRPFLPWLYAIVRYKFVDAVRRLKRESRYRIDITVDEWSELLEVPAEDADRRMLEIDRHLSDLPQGQQDVVHALAIKGATVRATARKLETSEGAVRMTFHRALQRLMARAELGQAATLRGKI
jgi:RNA polymerase sigma-70 factor (ECF subfamily)